VARSSVPRDDVLPRSGRRSAGLAAVESGEPAAEAPETAEANGNKTQQFPQSDATVILPLPRGRWATQDDRGSGH
jgi:hypothetical protein